MDTNALVIVAIGSNLGDPGSNVLRAIEQLREFSAQPLLSSSLWQTAPVDCPPGSPAFVNAVVAFVPRDDETSESLLEKLHALERSFGRQPKRMPNEARPLDLDLIAFRRETRNEAVLTLPHPRAHLRRFVLQPLVEILPGLCLPGKTRTVEQLLEELPADERVVKVRSEL